MLGSKNYHIDQYYMDACEWQNWQNCGRKLFFVDSTFQFINSRSVKSGQVHLSISRNGVGNTCYKSDGVLILADICHVSIQSVTVQHAYCTGLHLAISFTNTRKQCCNLQYTAQQKVSFLNSNETIVIQLSMECSLHSRVEHPKVGSNNSI